eukprot:3251547-Prymnesium_polylepis.1
MAENLEEAIPDEVEEMAGALAAPVAALTGAARQSRQATRESQSWRVRQVALLGLLRIVEAIDQRPTRSEEILKVRRDLKEQETKRDVWERQSAVRKLLNGGGAPLAASLNAFARKKAGASDDVAEENKQETIKTLKLLTDQLT